MTSNNGAVLAILGVAGLTLFLKSNRYSGYETFAVSDFIQPELVAGIAASLPENEDDFILAAWEMVGNEITYEPIASDIYFLGDTVQCLKCYRATAALERRLGNCVAKSSLLASILANRIPDDRLMMVIGDLRNNGTGGHAWLNVNRGGKWYLVESTLPPKMSNPWTEVSATGSVYIPAIYISRNEFICGDPEMCFTAGMSVAIDKGRMLTDCPVCSIQGARL